MFLFDAVMVIIDWNVIGFDIIIIIFIDILPNFMAFHLALLLTNYQIIKIQNNLGWIFINLIFMINYY